MAPEPGPEAEAELELVVEQLVAGLAVEVELAFGAELALEVELEIEEVLVHAEEALHSMSSLEEPLADSYVVEVGLVVVVVGVIVTLRSSIPPSQLPSTLD